MATTLVREGERQPEPAPTPRGSNPRGGRKSLLLSALACLVFAAILRNATSVDAEHERYGPRSSGVAQVVGGDWLAGMLLGFREMVADLMWIQVDSYFHEGRYDKILPVCYVVAAMDPGWIDVYSVGGWHLGYNFGDRRLVKAATDFEHLGVQNNPRNAEMWYEYGWMLWTRGYRFAEAAQAFRIANSLGLTPLARRHALPHALEDSGDLDGALQEWRKIQKVEPDSPVPQTQISRLLMREEARKDLWKHPVDLHMAVKVTRKGPRVLHVEGVINLPLLSKVFYDLSDVDAAARSKKPISWQLNHFTLYSAKDTTLAPSVGIFRGTQIDFYQGSLRYHQGSKSYDLFPTEPEVQVKNGHMVIPNGYFQFDIDMAKQPDQYPLEEKNYILTLYVNPRMEPINTQDVIDWDGSGMSGPGVRNIGGMKQFIWQMKLSRQDILGSSSAS